MNRKDTVIKVIEGILLLGFFSAISIPSASAKVYYVDIKGSDQGQGTKDSPWRTLNKALKSVNADQDHTIQIGSGSFDLGGKVTVPSGIKIIGSGIYATTIQGELRLLGGRNISLSKMQLNGKQYQYGTAVYIRDANQINLRDIAFRQYQAHAINIERSNDGELENLTIFDCTFNNRVPDKHSQQSAAIVLGNLTNVSFQNISINTLTRGGQGIGSMSDAWKPQGNSWVGPDSILKNVKFANLNIQVDKWNAWWNGWTPQMALELFKHKCYECEIYNSIFNGTVSLASIPTSQPDHQTRIHVHHNFWYGQNKPFYACEVSANNIEFNHNYIRGGFYPIASFGNKYRNLHVHNNIFEQTQGPVLVGLFEQKRENFQFINNIIYVSHSKYPLFLFKKGEAENQKIHNNSFYNLTENFQNLQLGITVGLNKNFFLKFNPWQYREERLQN
jgi:hypothetical protein